jgi:hypothetical protein
MSLPQPDHRVTASMPPRTPRWVKLSAFITIALILLAVISMFIIGGEHSPSRHLPSGTGGYTAPSAHQMHQL